VPKRAPQADLIGRGLACERDPEHYTIQVIALLTRRIARLHGARPRQRRSHSTNRVEGSRWVLVR
jgi:hypothetical protein